ncbi:MAG: hypothetical protein MHM6MM_005991 [Cercozoa sp. M6MM]
MNLRLGRKLSCQRRLASPPGLLPGNQRILGHLPLIVRKARVGVPFGAVVAELFDKDEEGRETAQISLPGSGDCVVITRSPLVVKEILQQQMRTGVAERVNGPMFDLFFEELAKGSKEFAPVKPGMLGSQGQRWKELRTAVSPVLMKPQASAALAKQFAPIARDFVEFVKSSSQNAQLPEEVAQYLDTIGSGKRVGVLLNTNRSMMNLALESIVAVITNMRLGVIPPLSRESAELFTKEEHVDFLDTVHAFFHAMGGAVKMAPLIPLHKQLRRLFNRGFPSLDSFVYNGLKLMHIVRTAVDKSIEVSPVQEVEPRTLDIDKRSVRDMLLDHPTLSKEDATSVLLELVVWVLYHMATNHEQFELVRDEVRALYEESNSNDEVFATKLTNAPRLRAVVNETLRLRPPIDGTTRRMPEDLSLERACPVTGPFADSSNFGKVAPKNSFVITPNQTMAMDKRVFGDNVASFDHMRWLKRNKNGDLKFDPLGTPVRFFGLGMRQCVGRRVAAAEIQVVLGFLFAEVEQFYLLHETGFQPKVDEGLVRKPGEAIRIAMSFR